MATKPVFQPSDASKFSDEARRIIALTRALGWSATWGNQAKRMVILRAPDGKEINVPTTNINYNRAKSWLNQVIRHSNNAQLAHILEGGGDLTNDPDLAEIVALVGGHMVTEFQDSEAKKRSPLGVKPQHLPVEEEVSAAQPELEIRTVVSRVPWLAHRGGTEGGKGRMYESQTTSLITFDDGSITYQCNFCDYTNDKPRAVAIHAGKNHPQWRGHKAVEQKGEKPAKPPKRKEPETFVVAEYHGTGLRRGAGVRRLANDIVKALDEIKAWQAMSVPDLAEAMAEVIVANRPVRAEHGEPLTDEEIVQRIAMLVDRGRLGEMHQQVENLTEQLRTTAEAREAAETELDKVRGNYRALREMVSSLGDEE